MRTYGQQTINRNNGLFHRGIDGGHKNCRNCLVDTARCAVYAHSARLRRRVRRVFKTQARRQGKLHIQEQLD